jgi:predicted PurR-regulated permease PerM
MPLPPSVQPKARLNYELHAVSAVVMGVTVIAALYFARELLIPLALAVLISFVLAPLANQLRRTGLPQGVCVIAVVIFSFGVILGIGAIGASQIAQLAENLPQYQTNLREKIRTIRTATSSSGAVTQATQVIEDLGREMSANKSGPQAGPAAGAGPVPVTIQTPNGNPLKVVSDYLQPLIGPLAGTGIVLIFVIFLLLQRQDLRDRVIRLLGTKSLHRTTDAMDEAAVRLSRYFLLQTAMNASFGAFVGLGLWLIGVPSPWLWGIFTMLLRFVPYIGSIIAAVLPVALAAAVDPGWTMVVWTIALFAIGEPIMGHVIEPLVYGHQTGLSPVAVVIAAAFWTWLWGPIGLLLATPLTLCLIILGQYTQRLEFLSVLLGDQPPLSPPESFYQRLIAGDPAEVIEQAEDALKEKPLLEFYDSVAIPGLTLAQIDLQLGDLAPERQTMLQEGVYELVDSLGDVPEAGAAKDADTAAAVKSIAGGKAPIAHPTVLITGGNNKVDHAAAALLKHACSQIGIAVYLPESHGLSGIAEHALGARPQEIVCISYVATAKPSQVRFAVSRVKRRLPGVKILLGLWNAGPNNPDVERIKTQSGCNFVALTFQEALSIIQKQTSAALEQAILDKDDRLQGWSPVTVAAKGA